MREIVLLIDNYFKYVNSKEVYQKKYSDSFENLIGQKPIVDILKNSIIDNIRCVTRKF